MADNPEVRGAQDRSRINLHQEHEVRYWTKALGVTEDQLKATVAKVGNSAEKVRAKLGKG
jgi:hypothetical protein